MEQSKLSKDLDTIINDIKQQGKNIERMGDHIRKFQESTQVPRRTGYETVLFDAAYADPDRIRKARYEAKQ